jgi:hypothetical protein
VHRRHGYSSQPTKTIWSTYWLWSCCDWPPISLTYAILLQQISVTHQPKKPKICVYHCLYHDQNQSLAALVHLSSLISLIPTRWDIVWWNDQSHCSTAQRHACLVLLRPNKAIRYYKVTRQTAPDEEQRHKNSLMGRSKQKRLLKLHQALLYACKEGVPAYCEEGGVIEVPDEVRFG